MIYHKYKDGCSLINRHTCLLHTCCIAGLQSSLASLLATQKHISYLIICLMLRLSEEIIGLRFRRNITLQYFTLQTITFLYNK